MKNSIPLLVCTILLLSMNPSALAQETVTKIKKFKPPHVQAQLGIRHNGDSVVLAEAVQLVALPLKVVDSGKDDYTIVNYHFAYHQKNFVIDPETGDVVETYTLEASPFRLTPLPDLWVENIRSSLKKGERLHYFDILVKDDKGRIFKAPDLIITVK